MRKYVKNHGIIFGGPQTFQLVLGLEKVGNAEVEHITLLKAIF
jgi:hypothetical protein